MFKFFAREYHAMPDQVLDLRQMEFLMLMGALVPDHVILKLPNYLQYGRTAENRDILKRVHGR